MEEIWKDIPGYEGYYQASIFGRIKSIKKSLRRKNGIIAPLNCKGYHRVYLYKNGRKLLSVHRIVALAFIENPLNKPAINHINGVRNDNRVDNLEWVTNSENSVHSIYKLNNRIDWSKINRKKGKDSPLSKPVLMFSMDGEFLMEHCSIREASKNMNINACSISGNLRGRSKTAGGYIWKYK